MGVRLDRAIQGVVDRVDEQDVIVTYHKFVIEHFGGDYSRAALWVAVNNYRRGFI